MNKISNIVKTQLNTFVGNKYPNKVNINANTKTSKSKVIIQFRDEELLIS